MLHLIQSNKMELLLASLLQKLALQTFEEQGSDSDLVALLQPDTILVQSPGMSQWLKINIANTLNIAANIEFPLPSSFIWQLYQASIEDLPDESAFNKQFLTWKILQLLPQLLAQPEFEDVKNYIGDSAEADLAELPKAYQLSAKIADVYDQYLMYRPEWIQAWERGENQLPDVNIGAQAWQPVLWRAISQFTQQAGESPWHRANMHDALLEQLNKATGQVDKALYVFGISSMPVQQLQILQALSQSREVYIFWFNPSEHYWADVVDSKQYQKQQLSLFDEPDEKQQIRQQQAFALSDVGNPLLASWGKPGRDFLSLLTDLEPLQEDLFQAPEQSHLLGWVQKEVFQLSFRGSRQPLSVADLLKNNGKHAKQILREDDHSIEIHATHSRLRELEVLRDQICHWFDNGDVSDLSDIIVMMPDVAVYAPLIEAVFSRPLISKELAQQGGLPFAISDRSQAQEDSLVESFLRLMSLENARMTLSEVFELFKVPEIAARYGIEQDDIQALHRWCYQAGVRWGWSGLEKQHWDLPEEQQNTWVFGLQRLLAGYAHPGEESLMGGTLPFNEVEGQLTESLGLLLAFVEDLRALTAFCRCSHGLERKVSESLAVLDCFYQVEADDEYRLQKLKETVAKLKGQGQHYQGLVSQQVFVEMLKDALNESGVGQRFLAGKLNFCTLMPMRSIPFRHVCILGMNEPEYPRQTTPISFDLVSRSQPRKGDRSRRLDDRYLFLEAMLSARNKFYLSYQGRDDKSNEVKEPSILVSELLAYCQQTACLEADMVRSVDDAEQAIRAHIFKTHPLQPWDKSYFSAKQPQSYDKTMFEVADTLQQQPVPVSFCRASQLDIAALTKWLEDYPEIQALLAANQQSDLSGLIQFYRNPVRAWFKSYWKTQFPSLQEGLHDDEPLYLDNLARYQATQQLLQGSSESSVLLALEQQGQLPIGNLKLLEQSELSDRAQLLKSKLEAITGKADTQLNSQWIFTQVAVLGVNVELQGAIPLAPNNDMILYRPGKLSATDRLSCWMTWCLYCAAAQRQSKGWFLALDKSIFFDPLTMEEASQELQKLITIMLVGQVRCLPFFPKTALQWADTHDEAKTHFAYIGSQFLPGEADEPHNARVYPALQECWPEFAQLADELFQPILAREQWQ
ncbi:exodeoxyribonuclease V subunit gamma [Planctobacterium marinum]|uniref:exodeoxyribonuclease V subunit gamma n=1 Tax=Planctobacterium marinum TaxID=1631968 RepID=UPI001E6180AE|nr:exodeoxyribonuclease V subunit gamma [Planctobacterium marinum]MCC2604550.1 exodeoxyribonuclease V subunit gamma [Planctobacterium marinum]